MRPQRNDLTATEIAGIIQTALVPLTNRMQDMATRSDIEKLRTELVNTMVPRDSYEPRHVAIIERQTQLENMLREARKEHQEALQKIHERLESGKEQIEQRIDTIKDAELSAKDRAWLRFSQIMSILALLAALLGAFIGHIHFQ
jgi:type VI protein secretion system component VasF